MKKPKALRRPWTPLERLPLNPALAALGEGWAAAYGNETYQVMTREVPVNLPGWPASVTHLSIKRNDRREVHDWRDLQRVKNEVCGEAAEAVEVYPAERRLVDTANQYHLWVFPDGFELPFGYGFRAVADGTGRLTETGARQRPFRGDERPADAISPERAEALTKAALGD